MPSSESTTASPSSSMAGRSSKKRSKTVVFKLPSTLLSRWPGVAPSSNGSDEKPEEKKVEASSSPSASSTPPLAQASSAGPGSDATPAAAAAAAPATVDVDADADPAIDPAAAPTASPEAAKRKGVPGPKPGSKRGAPVDALPKPRGKPGPKKKPRLEDGTIDHSAVARATVHPGPHKLGPKANQGAINAGLRALDRTGKPTRKWERKPFNLKSFTGIVWDMSSWRAPPKPKPVAEDGDSTAKPEEALPANGDADADADADAYDKESNSVTDKSNTGDAESTPFATNGFSSPAPALAVAS